MKNLLKYLFARKKFTFKINNSKLLVRPRTHDLYIIHTIFKQKDYLPTITQLKNVKNILDLGANIGTFSLWANDQYQPKKIIAVEPEQENFSILKQNIRLNDAKKVIKPLNTAIYKEKTAIGMKKWSYNKGMHSLDEESTENQVETITFKKLINSEFKNEMIDFLKIDIEGAEKYIFTKENKGIIKNQVKYIAMETHKVWGYSKEQALKYFAEIGFEAKARKNKFYKSCGVSLVEAVNEKF